MKMLYLRLKVKVCNCCGITKPLDKFWKRKASKDWKNG